MAKRTQTMTTLTPTAFADGAVSMTDATYPHIIQGGTSTQINLIWEISLQGQEASTSSPTFMILSYDGTQVGSGANSSGAGQADGPVNPATAALASPPKVGNTWATNKPQRSLAGHLASYSINALSGAAFWRANKMDECFQTLGNAVTTGEISLSAFTGGTPGHLGSHLIYEPL